MTFANFRGATLVVLFAAFVFPVFSKEVEISPAWSVQVVDNSGRPVPGLAVEESWEFFGIPSSGTDSQRTDSRGRVSFPRRVFSVTEAHYLLSQGASHLNVHASFGPSASVMVRPKGAKIVRASYDDEKVFDDLGATTMRKATGFETILRVLPRDIFDFIADRDWTVVKRVIAESPTAVSLRDRGGFTPLIKVAALERFSGEPAEVVRLLIDKGADVNAQANDGTTALHRAAQNHDVAEMEYLLSQKAAPNPRIHDSVYYTTNGFTPLHFQLGAYDIGLSTTSASDRIKGIALLLDHGADVNAKDAAGNSPLHLAAEWGDPDIVAALLARGADPWAVNSAGQTPRALIQAFSDTPEIRRLKNVLSAAEQTSSKPKR